MFGGGWPGGRGETRTEAEIGTTSGVVALTGLAPAVISTQQRLQAAAKLSLLFLGGSGISL